LLLPPVFIAVLLVMDVAVPGVAQGSGHLPIIDIVPTSSFTTTSDGIDDDDALSAVSIAGVGRIFPGGGRDLVRVYRGDHATHQNLSPDSLAALPAGLAVPNGRSILTTQQFASAIVPVGGPTGTHLTGTFIWGALNDFENEPFPW